MKSKIKKILLDNLKSAHDDGNVDDGSIIGGDNTVDHLYDLFVDEMTAIDTATATLSSRPEEKNEYIKSMIESGDWFSKSKKPTDILYTNPETGKAQKLFDTLIPVYTVRCGETITIGDKGCAVFIHVGAITKEEAIDKAIKNKEFTSHIRMKDFDKKYLTVYQPTGNYVIGKVLYYEGDERL